VVVLISTHTREGAAIAPTPYVEEAMLAARRSHRLQIANEPSLFEQESDEVSHSVVSS